MTDAYLYQSALLCADCAQARIIQVESTRPLPAGYPDDSDAYPQGPYPQGGGEADSPQHCDHCNVFLENPLTGDGYDYVVAMIDDYVSNTPRQKEILCEWARYYKEDNDDLDRVIKEAGL